MPTRKHKPDQKAASTRSPRARATRPAGAGGAAPEPQLSSLSNAELDALYAGFLKQPAQLTKAELNALERRLCTADAEWRRLALASLTKSGAELKGRFAGSREAAQLAAELLTVAEDMGKRMHELAGMLETASTRLMLSLCERPDMHELIAAAKTQLEGGASEPADEPS